MKTQKRKMGDWGEAAASRFLIRKGYTIVARNFRIRTGEIDIIARVKKRRFGSTLCFVEVKTRSGFDGSAERALTREKLERMLKAAKAYCMEKDINITHTPIQFEQVSVYIGAVSGQMEIRHYEVPM